ncbi:placenta growth factor isoform X8 [Canis lupus baileyi]|uniref:placenta growth factor isoform X7 n=1 Tax=Canis lupus familiaris TaxID=9615 RepID=UPI000BAA02AE|nr:placenta growth factor isoform X7 [Canis lupus familiaris]XP_038401220.1 placenta growth factor isoform X7 [Canis lupus familiaris]XP_038530141.1 placenta growth factor isoform X7 [Canis lupus familiaris]|eukprot:XP_022277931.1 placenta growth factor isoform X7 [Canis lupus familiaris]
MSTHFPGARLDHVFWEETSGPAVSDSSSGESPAPTEERVGWAALQRQMSPIPATAGLLQGWPEQLALSAGNGSSEVEVVPFQQVWGRSYCRALEKLVDVLSEYPDEVEHMFNPSCVSLLRCSGCCGDENLHCMPVETANVTMQLLMIHSTGRPSYVELTFSQHIRCQCRPPLEDMKLESHFVLTLLAYCRRRPKGRGKRKREKQRPTDCHLCGHTVPQR